jgi:LEA14-like dessication related protein
MNKNTKLMILAFVIIVVFLAAWYLLFQSVPQGPEPQPFVSNITVLSSNGSNINGIYVINGVVQNKNSFNITVVNLNATGYSSNGSIVSTGNGFTTTSPIAPGGTSNFSVSLYDPNRLVTTYKIQVEDASSK